jgi:hypothetical protein
MGVLSSQELARTFENEVGGQPRAVRTWAVTLSDDTLQNNPTTHADIANHLGLANWGAEHDEFAWIGLRKLTITERFQDSPYHVQAVAEYGVVTANELLTPITRTAEWSFEGTAGEVPALFFWDGTTRRPLVNSAYDFFEGLQTTEQLVKATVRKNYETWPEIASKIAANNKVNQEGYLGCATHSWKVNGVGAAYITEVYNNVSYTYWQMTAELLYRQSGWNLFLPDVGWNYIDGGQKRRAMVFDFENGEWVASANPVGLTNTGGMNFTTWPNILERRVNEEANFAELFGLPPGAD